LPYSKAPHDTTSEVVSCGARFVILIALPLRPHRQQGGGYNACVFVVACLVARSPGQVYQFFERRSASLGGVLLSDATSPLGLRALVAAGGTLPDVATVFLEVHGPVLARVFAAGPEQPPLTLLFAGAERWGWRRWRVAQNGAAVAAEAFDEVVDDAPKAASTGVGVHLLRLFPGASRALPRPEPDSARARAIRWAREQGLPIDRVPGVAKKRVPIIDYATVAGLDQRGLLVEDSPRLYRFTFEPPASQAPRAVQ